MTMQLIDLLDEEEIEDVEQAKIEAKRMKTKYGLQFNSDGDN